jgi:hypothetical protein
LSYSGTPVVIERRKGIFRRVVITPDDPEAFVVAVKEHLSQNQNSRGHQSGN